MLGRLATYVVPAASVVVTALVLFGPGSPNPAPFVRVRGVPMAGGKTLALRLEGSRRLFGVDDVAALEGVTVEAHDGTTKLVPTTLTLSPDGVGEASIAADTPLVGPLDVRVFQGKTVLAEGTVLLVPAAPPKLGSTPVQGVATGDLRVSVVVHRGFLAAPFPEALDVHVHEHDGGAPGSPREITIDASAPGATIQPEKARIRDRGPATITVTPLAHLVELTLVARDDKGKEGRWEGLLPVRPGAIWLDPDRKAGLSLVSPAPRDRVYVSVVTDAGRILGAIVPLARDDAGFFRGRFDYTPEARLTQLVVAGDPQERGDATVTWPLVPHAGAATAARLELLLDGSAPAEARERARAMRARLAAVLLVLAAAVAEVLLIIVRTGLAQRDLEANLAEAVALEHHKGAGAPVPVADRGFILAAARESHPALRIALAVALVALGFALIAALSTFRR